MVRYRISADIFNCKLTINWIEYWTLRNWYCFTSYVISKNIFQTNIFHIPTHFKQCFTEAFRIGFFLRSHDYVSECRKIYLNDFRWYWNQILFWNIHILKEKKIKNQYPHIILTKSILCQHILTAYSFPHQKYTIQLTLRTKIIRTYIYLIIRMEVKLLKWNTC